MSKREDLGFAPGGFPRPDVPRLSVPERDNRWARVRALMDRDGLDAILALNNSANMDQSNGNGRYLSSIGGNGAQVSVVFPRHGEVTAVTGPVPTPDYWLQYQEWVTDIRTSFFTSTPVIVERLKELDLEGGRIGIAGLSGVAREPDGTVCLGTFTALQTELPHAEFVNATLLMDEVRFVKSDEEITLLQRGVQCVEAAFDVLDREATAGAPESWVYAQMMASMIEKGAEPNQLLLMAAGSPLPPVATMLPSVRPLGRDDVVMIEADAKWGGYLGHSTTTVWVDKPDDVDRAMAELQVEATQKCWDALRPGAMLGDFAALCADVAAGSGFECQPIMHSRGTGLDAPVLVARARDDRTKNWAVEENSVFIVKPRVTSRDGKRKVIWGDTVVVTQDGAQRLGSRPPLAAAIGG